MAKGRSSKATVTAASTEATKKVSNVENATILDAGNENDAEWNFLRVTTNDNATTLCKNDGCEEPAVAVWVNKSNLQDERPLCETCQEKEHGGWPNEGSRVDTVASKSKVLVESTENATTETPTKVKHEEESRKCHGR